MKVTLENYKQWGDTVNAYYNRLQKIWDELQHYMQLPVSDISALIIKERDEEQVHQFLMRLNDSMYGTVQSRIIQEKPLPKLKSVFARICKKEQHHNFARTAVAT